MYNIIIYPIIFLFWLSYAACEGTREAFYFRAAFENGNKEFDDDLHPLFTLQRFITILILMALAIPIYGGISVIMLISCILAFSYIHNGMYFSQRNKLNHKVYPKRWRDDSTTSRAAFNFLYKERLIHFIIALALHTSTWIVLIVRYYGKH